MTRDGDWMLAPAKVNLGLRITGTRSDGYHELDSIFAPLDFGDRLRLEITEASAPEISLRVEGADGDVPAHSENLAWRAADAFLTATGSPWQVKITLEKAIPTGAGLGGGSSDAGAVLQALAQRSPKGLAPGALADLALELGADVPFFLDPQPARVRGIGERIDPQAGVPSLPLLLAHPGEPLATPEVYRAYDALAATAPSTAAAGLIPDAEAWDPETLTDRLHNDLEAAARRLCPALGRIRQQLQALGATAVAMSGSGATMYGVFPDLDAASAAQEQGNFPWSRVASTLESR